MTFVDLRLSPHNLEFRFYLMSLRNLSEQHLSTPNQSHLADMYTVNASEGEEEHCQHNDKRRRFLVSLGVGRVDFC